MERYFSSIEPWRELLEGEFNRGYLTGVALVLGVVLLMLVLKIVLVLIFRNRRVRNITVNAADGEVVISQDAIDAALDLILCRFPEFVLESMKIYARGKHAYTLQMHCRFLAGAVAFPDVVAKIKEAIFQGLETQFNIRDLKKIRIILDSWDGKTAQSLRDDPMLKAALEPESVFKPEDAGKPQQDPPQEQEQQ